jgi:dihydroorotase
LNHERIRISGGRIIDPANQIDRDGPLCIADGRIVAVGYQPDDFVPDRDLAVPGCIVSPGFVDLCVRVREPGQEHKGTLASEGAAAAAGGITTFCVPPDTIPVIDTPAVARLLKERGQRVARLRVLPIGALTRGLNGTDLSEMSALKDAGCPAVGNASVPLASSLVLRRAFEYSVSSGLPVILRPEDPALRDRGCAHEGSIATRLGLPGIPEAAETVAVAQSLALIEHTGVRAHFGRLSSARAARMIAEAQQRGLPVSADVAIHQLHLTEEDVDGFDALCHVEPPLRTVTDRERLRSALAEGVIGAICSDHQPHDLDAKLDVFAATEPGMAALETLLPLTLRLVNEGVLSLPEALARLTCGPASMLGLPAGRLDPGAPADLCIFDPRACWRLEDPNWRSAGRNTPFWGQSMIGRVTSTLVDGKVVFQG